MTREEQILEKLGNIVTALEYDEKTRSKIELSSNLKSWLGVLLGTISLIGFIISPFVKITDDFRQFKREQLQKEQKINMEIKRLEYVIWKNVEGADEFLNNPYKERGVIIDKDEFSR